MIGRSMNMREKCMIRLLWNSVWTARFWHLGTAGLSINYDGLTGSMPCCTMILFATVWPTTIGRTSTV